jgi:hypothetical protein
MPMKITQSVQSQMHIDIQGKANEWVSSAMGAVLTWGWVLNTGKQMQWQDLQHPSIITCGIFFFPLVLSIAGTAQLIRFRATEACTFDRERGLVLLQQRSLWGATSQAQYALKDIRDITIKRYSGEDSDSFRILLDLGKLSPPIALSGFASEEKALSGQVESIREFLNLPQKSTYR